MLQTTFDFVLPKGYLDEQGVLHQHGTMRLATALDEIAPLRDPRVRSNEAYLVIALLAQVITRLGTLPRVTTSVVEGLFASDMAYLQNLYRQINEAELPTFQVVCPKCGHEFEAEVPPLGEL